VARLISSASNPRLKLVRKLGTRRQRDRLGRFVCEGEDLVAAAFNAAVRKAEETSEAKLGKLTAGMPGLPGGMKFPF